MRNNSSLILPALSLALFKNVTPNSIYQNCKLLPRNVIINFINRRELCRLPDEDFCEVPLRPNTDMEIWNKAVQLLKGKDAALSSSTLPSSNISSKTTPVHG